MMVCLLLVVIPAKAGIQCKNGCPAKNLGHDGSNERIAEYYYETVHSKSLNN